jgi:NADH pyrophosphatase NudC (nudix superfamily)
METLTMAEKEYISKTAFLDQKRKQYCEDCERRKGMKNGKYKMLYEIGDAPCRACSVDDMLNDVEDFPAADVEPVRHGEWVYNSPEDNIPYCSECLMPQDSECNFCPSCGAKMDGRNNNG